MGPEVSRLLYLPAGTWYDYWDGTLHEGSRWITVDAPLDRIPVFVRAGHILPLADAAQCTDEIDDEKLTLHIYPDSAGQASYALIGDAAGSSEDAGDFDHPTRTVHIRSERAGGQIRVTVEPRLREIGVELPPSERGDWTLSE